MQNSAKPDSTSASADLKDPIQTKAADDDAQMPDATVGSKPPPQAQSQFAMLQTALGKFSDEQLFAALSQVTDLRLVGVIARRLDPATASSGRVDQTTDAQADHRSANRAKTLRSGKIIYNNKMSVSDCSIRDISETGCRISMESTAGIPKNFLLHIVNGDVRHECEVAWRSSTAMGVKFIG